MVFNLHLPLEYVHTFTKTLKVLKMLIIIG